MVAFKYSHMTKYKYISCVYYEKTNNIHNNKFIISLHMMYTKT